MDSAHVFSPEQLRRLSMQPGDLLLEALREGKREKAKAWAEKIVPLLRSAYDVRVTWDTGIQRYILDRMGVDALYDVCRYKGFLEKDMAALRTTKEAERALYEAVDTGDVDTCANWMKEQERLITRIRDIRVPWENRMLSFIYEQQGLHGAYEAMASFLITPYIGRISAFAANGFDIRHRVINQVWGLHKYPSPLIVEEDDEKVSVTMQPCGGGTYLLEHGDFEAPQRCALCMEKCPETYGVGHFPIYCIHSSVQEMASIRLIGWPIIVNAPWEDCEKEGYRFAENSCHFEHFKRPEYVPDKVYELLGQTRPQTYYFPGYSGYDFTPADVDISTQTAWRALYDLYFGN